MTFSQFLRKLVSESDVFGKKTCLESKTLRKIRFWINFLTTPETFKQNNYFVSKCKLNIHIASNLSQYFTNALDFAEKTGLRKSNFFLENWLSKKHLSGQYTPLKRQSWLFFVNSPKICSGKIVFFFFIKKFFGSEFLKKFSFWIICWTKRHILHQEIQMRQS